jgi:hypothetical protein
MVLPHLSSTYSHSRCADVCHIGQVQKGHWVCGVGQLGRESIHIEYTCIYYLCGEYIYIYIYYVYMPPPITGAWPARRRACRGDRLCPPGRQLDSERGIYIRNIHIYIYYIYNYLCGGPQADARKPPSTLLLLVSVRRNNYPGTTGVLKTMINSTAEDSTMSPYGNI